MNVFFYYLEMLFRVVMCVYVRMYVCMYCMYEAIPSQHI